jgi:hypothetical protein
MQRARLSGLVLVAALALACGGGDGGDDGGGGGTIDASTGDLPDADQGPTIDAGVEGVTCGGETCDETMEECCLTGGGAQSCVENDTCQGTTFGCDGPEDCTVEGQTCCGSAQGTQCQSAATCEAAVCHTPEDCPTAGDKCCSLPATDSGLCLPNCPGA